MLLDTIPFLVDKEYKIELTGDTEQLEHVRRFLEVTSVYSFSFLPLYKSQAITVAFYRGYAPLAEDDLTENLLQTQELTVEEAYELAYQSEGEQEMTLAERTQTLAIELMTKAMAYRTLYFSNRQTLGKTFGKPSQDLAGKIRESLAFAENKLPEKDYKKLSAAINEKLRIFEN